MHSIWIPLAKHIALNIVTNKKIILVEDNPGEAKLALLAFKELAIPNPTVHYDDGYRFLHDLIHSDLDNIAFVLLDLNMPTINGKEVLRTIQKDHNLRSLPVLIYSSSGHEDDIEECYDLGAKAYIRKPLNYNRFKEILENTYRFWVQDIARPSPLRQVS